MTGDMRGEGIFKRQEEQGRRRPWRRLVFRLLVGPLVAVVVIVFLLVSLLLDFRERREDASLQRQALLIMRELTTATTYVTDMETSLRGYLLTGDEAFLRQLEASRANALRQVTRLEDTLGQPLDDVREALQQWHEELAPPENARRAPALANQAQQNRHMNTALLRLSEVNVEQQLLLAQIGDRPQAVDLSLRVLIGYNTLISSVLRMEQGFFGFLLTGTPEALEPYLGGRLEYRQSLRLLEGLVTMPAQQQRLEAIGLLVGRWLTEAAEPGIALRQAEAPLSLVDLERGQEFIAGVRQLGAEFYEVESEHYERHLATAQASRRNEELRLLLISSVALVVLLLSSHYGVSTTLNYLSNLDKEAERVAFFALHDALTGLPNRVLFRDRLEHELQRAKRNSSQVAVLFLDLDGFKEINDQAGHASGDQLLVAIARRLKHSTRQSDTVARLGGDEFAIILADVGGYHGAAVVARALLEAVRQPLELKGRYYQVSTSIGISLYPEDTEDVEKLINNADRAMYAAKNTGKDNSLFYSQLVRTSF